MRYVTLCLAVRPCPTTAPDRLRPGFSHVWRPRCLPFEAADDAELTAERAARDRAIDGNDECSYLFHEARVDDLIHLRQLRARRMTAVFGCDTAAADVLAYRIDCIERGVADPGEAR